MFISLTGSAILPSRTRKPCTPKEKSPVVLFELPPMNPVTRIASPTSARSCARDFGPSVHRRLERPLVVGAIFVGSIDTVWAGTVTPSGRRIADWSYGEADTTVQLERGAEMGRFNMGSTVILLYGAERVQWAESLVPGTKVRMGEQIGRVVDTAA